MTHYSLTSNCPINGMDGGDQHGQPTRAWVSMNHRFAKVIPTATLGGSQCVIRSFRGRVAPFFVRVSRGPVFTSYTSTCSMVREVFEANFWLE